MATGGQNGGGVDEGDLHKTVENFFAESENSVIMAFRVAKSTIVMRTRLSTKPRVLALTGN